MPSTHSTRHNRIYCALTERNVTIASDVVSIDTLQGTISRDGRKLCLDKRTTCPQDCIYISGGKGWGIDPQTGQRVTTPGL